MPQIISQKKLGIKVGIIYDSSDAYSSGIYEKFKGREPMSRLEIVAAEAFTADNKSDLSRKVTPSASRRCPDLVFLGSSTIRTASRF